MTSRQTRSFPIAAAILLGLFIAGFSAGFFGWRVYYDHRKSNFTGKAELYVYPNMNVSDVMDELLEKGVVRKPGSLRRAFRREGIMTGNGKPGASSVRPGHYTVTPSNSSVYVARMLKNGWQSPVNLVLSGSIRLRSSLARKISSQMMMDSLTVMKALRDSALLSGYGFTPENVFGLFIPDTYQVYWTDPMSVVLDKQKTAFDAFWTPANIEKAQAQGLSVMEAVTLASIVRGESNYVPEYPLIAGVYLNRLHIGMKLQADPTVAFCFDYTLNRIMRNHTKVDSPYNTYMHAGLPPAPICSPGRDAMNAVLNPEGGKDLYFCASPDFNGTHLFAATYSEHLKNARAFQRALTARLAAKAAAEQ